MNLKFEKILQEFKRAPRAELFAKSLHGLERECLRIDSKGMISRKPHPEEYGAPLTNPRVTTDFSEAQIEMVTPPLTSEKYALSYLKNIQIFIRKHLDKNKESIWPISMPSRLPKDPLKIPVAQYGESSKGKAKTIYRKGLLNRYGSKMQAICGTHYNYSFPEKFWDLQMKLTKTKKSRTEFINDSYFHLMRNFLRLSWLEIYLFGSSPAFDESFITKKHPALKKFGKRTYYGEHTTSFRTSELGYGYPAQTRLNVSFNSLDEYIDDLERILSTPHPQYEKYKDQLNSNLLQIPNEYYSAARPKRAELGHESIVDALKNRGVQYLEIRCPDLCTNCSTGVGVSNLRFLHTLIIYSLFKASPKMSTEEHIQTVQNNNMVSLYGRKKNLKLLKKGKEISMKNWALAELKSMRKVAEILDKATSSTDYTQTIDKQIEKVNDPAKTPSAKMLKEMKDGKMEYLDYGTKIAKGFQEKFKTSRVYPEIQKELKAIAKKSVQDKEDFEAWDEMFTLGYEDMEVSTQIVIKEALKRGLKIEILDRKDNFIYISKGSKGQYVKQATKTGLDSYITFLIMENKQVTKKVLEKHKIRVPKGGIYYTERSALRNLPNVKSVVKPTSTNFGIGIGFTDAGEKIQYKKAVQEAFKHGDSVIVEEFVEGKEFRLLVIGRKVVGVIHRIPANITGDGIHKIKELIKLKNANPKNFKIKKEHIRTGEAEKSKLRKQGLTINSIPNKGQQVFLRDNSNVSTGGDPIDMSEDVHKSYKEAAVKAAKAMNARICGVDLIIKDIKKPATKNNYAIIETNFNPVLKFHNFPQEGKNRKVGKAVLDLLGF